MGWDLEVWKLKAQVLELLMRPRHWLPAQL
jgi:hypothetical protein